MRRKTWKRVFIIPGAALCATQLALVYAAEAPAASGAKWYDTVAVNGYVQGSYTGKFNAGPNNKTSQGRAFDANANSFNFNSFLLQISKPVGESDHYGFVTKLRTGHDAGVLASGNDNSVFVEEAYVTYALPSMSKLSFSAGKFLTPEGFEGADTVYNPNFSEGLLWTLAEPVTHTGIKANYVISDKANATVGLVNGWDVTSDNNDNKTILWQLATTPMKQLTWSFQGTYGNELTTPAATAYQDHSKRLSLDTVVGFSPMDKLSLNGQLNWGQQTHSPGTVDGTSHWDGLGLWVSYVTSPMFTETVRFEVFDDQSGGVRTGLKQTAKEFTLTHKTMLTSNLGTRLEYRHDWSNEAYFTRKDGSAVTNQNTIAMDWFVTF